ncbi:MAG: glycerol-3-phosphate 1-O-acyltransferase PlsY [Alphaproteobacteria bacterium]|nr:glycerol-3-phosphate 1-O-acyltransferase PlsY [Alphaproteobacteria bacterium]
MIDPISWEFAWPYILAAFAGGYLFGSVPWGLLLSKYGGAGDIRRVGSGNIGATNVLRTGHKGLAVATLLLDVAKGAAAVLIGGLYGPDTAVIAGAGAFVGHVFPVWLRFDGGKGVATALGILFALSWTAALGVLALFAAAVAVTRYVSVGSLLGSAAAPVLCYWLATPQKAELMLALGVLIWLRHAGNIRRLVKGEESRIGAK